MLVMAAPLILVLSLGVLAQTSTTQIPPPKKAKIVWTNDNLEQLGAGTRWTPGGGPPPATVIPGATEPNADVKDKDKPPVKTERDPKPYLKKLAPLRVNVAMLDAQIKELRDQLKNPIEGSNAVDLRHASVVMRPADLLAELELKRKNTQQQISDIEDEARRNGYSLNELR